MIGDHPRLRVAVLGGGFAGLAAAYELVTQGAEVTLYEAEATLGGLAGSFSVGGQPLEKFYHHFFSTDASLTELVQELGVEDHVVARPSTTGMYFTNRFHRMASPVDLLRFAPLPLVDRLRLGWLALRSRWIKDWKPLEHQTAADWLISVAGRRVYETIWEPLLVNKFGRYANTVSAVHIWTTLTIHGGARRAKTGAERLSYFRGGFAALATRISERIRAVATEL